ncbi:hypothetical protein A1O3_03102 [Capronia epimyces CBS 606.96]|uniref:Uncharacterized protein n=1 Tax=Capronia epimyces CBS 606.96 TaxID=1182542 RepID=W9Z6B5_9EURO|nr:uncharacterized protein A1O3_03102 [Capronia epimyces CBS 606.96]EXJ90034.1 hypothetical protein A1O3_03102 [Capronia epimyces CBS 606.96]
MQPLTRPPSRDLDCHRRPGRSLSREETYHLADTARRKSSDRVVRDDLRLKLSHGHLLELLLLDLARTERELQTSRTDDKYLMAEERKGSKESRLRPKRTVEAASSSASSADVDEYGFPLDLDEEDGEESVGGLALMRTESRRPMR